MKQVTQRLRDGRISVIDIPAPTVSPDGVLVDVRASLLSAGTERSKVKTGQQSLIGKARARPDQVRQVIDKAQRDGIGETVRAVRSRLEQPSPLGYSAAGVVLAVGGRVRDIAPGDRVACGGADYAVHAELDHVPANLCVPLPDEVAFESGAFATVGSIAMHGVRQADVRLGEKVAVIGLGLVGQLAGQILRAAGCRVVGIDLSRELLERARAVGAADAALERAQLEDERLPAEAAGCDAILITAATPSDDPVRLAAHLARDRARVVIVGDVGLAIPRAPYYEKELDLRLSRSYGPGRYDKEYEERGLDYPIGYVRWTERRNMLSFIELVASGRVNVEGLVTDRFAVEEAEAAYERLVASDSSPLAMILTYAPTAPPATERAAARRWSAATSPKPTIGLIGTGSFAQGTVAPGLQRAGFRIAAVASATGLSAHATRERFQADRLLSPEEVIADSAIEAVAVVTRHATHAAYATAALSAGKSVFVEKPACLTWDELERAAAGHGRRPTAARGLQSPPRPAGPGDARPRRGPRAPGRASLPGQRRAPAPRALAERPGRRRWATGGRGVSFHRFRLLAPRRAAAPRQRGDARRAGRAAGRGAELQRHPRLRRRRARDRVLRLRRGAGARQGVLRGPRRGAIGRPGRLRPPHPL